MSDTEFQVHFAPNPGALADTAAEFIAARLEKALDRDGRASLALSGGSSPRLTHEKLGDKPLAWKGVGVSLVDERWVPAGSEGSNADFIHDCFAERPAAQAHFVPLYNGHETPAKGLDAAEQALAMIKQPFDVCVLGMGSDGHTASWFPNAPDLDSALDSNNHRTLCAPDASGQAGSSGFAERISLTYAAVADAACAVLLLPSVKKWAVFQSIADKSSHDAPVNALRSLGNRLHVFAVET